MMKLWLTVSSRRKKSFILRYQPYQSSSKGFQLWDRARLLGIKLKLGFPVRTLLAYQAIRQYVPRLRLLGAKLFYTIFDCEGRARLGSLYRSRAVSPMDHRRRYGFQIWKEGKAKAMKLFNCVIWIHERDCIVKSILQYNETIFCCSLYACFLLIGTLDFPLFRRD